MADRQMQYLGEAHGVRWWWAEPGHFEKPGVYYWNGSENILVMPVAAPSPVAPVAVMLRMIAGIDHLSEVARQWEPDHSSGADRRGWVLAKDARDDAVRLLQEHAQRMDATPQPSETQGRRQMTHQQRVDAFDRINNLDIDVYDAFLLGIDTAEAHHGIPASPQKK